MESQDDTPRAAPGLNLENLTQVYRQLRALPLARGLWVVDMPWAEREMLAVFHAHSAPVNGPPQLNALLSGAAATMPLWVWRSAASNEAEHLAQLRLGRWFVRWPGVWIEMSNQRHTQIRVTTLEDARRVALIALGQIKAADDAGAGRAE